MPLYIILNLTLSCDVIVPQRSLRKDDICYLRAYLQIVLFLDKILMFVFIPVFDDSGNFVLYPTMLGVKGT